MWPVALVLLVASKALANVGAIQLGIGDVLNIVPIISSNEVNKALELIGVDSNIYLVTTQQVIRDLANSVDGNNQVRGLVLLVTWIGSLAPGIPGDACLESEVIDLYVRGDSAVFEYIPIWSLNFDRILQLIIDEDSLRFVTGPRGNCKDGGRVYLFVEAWDAILENVNFELINDLYSAAKRLYSDEDNRSRNAAAAITAASVPDFLGAIEKAKAVEPIAKFVRFISSGDIELISAAAQVAKDALSQVRAD